MTRSGSKEGGREPGDRLLDELRRLRERPTPELDSEALWGAVAARLEPREEQRDVAVPAGPARRRRWLRAAWPAGLAAAAALVVGVLYLGGVGEPAGDADSRIVWLSPDGPETTVPAAAGPSAPGAAAGVGLTLRLVRGFDGAPAEEIVEGMASGAGGADPLADLRPRMESLLPFDRYGLLGSWEGTVTGRDRAAIGSRWELLVEEVRRRAGNAAGEPAVVELVGLRLVGDGRELLLSDLALVPGRQYFLGVLEEAADVPSLVLVVEAAAGEPRR